MQLLDSNTFKYLNTPEMFGAIGDGITDDTIAIQGALDNSSYIIFDKEKTYLISDKLYIHSNTYIDFNMCTIIKSVDNACFLNDSCYTTCDNENITIKNLIMTTDGKGARWYSLLFVGVNKLTIDNIDITSDTPYTDGATGAWSAYICGKDIRLSHIVIDSYKADKWGDGLHFGYVEDLVLTDFNIKSGDDCIAFCPAPRNYFPQGILNKVSKNIVVSNGMCTSKMANALKIAAHSISSTNTSDDANAENNIVYQNVYIHDIIVDSTPEDCQMCLIDLTDIRLPDFITGKHDNIVFRNIQVNGVMKGDHQLIRIESGYSVDSSGSPIKTAQRNYGTVTFDNVSCERLHTTNGCVLGAYGAENIIIKNSVLSRGTDVVHTYKAMQIYNVDNITFDNVKLIDNVSVSQNSFSYVKKLTFKQFEAVNSNEESQKYNSIVIGYNDEDITELLIENCYFENWYMTFTTWEFSAKIQKAYVKGTKVKDCSVLFNSGVKSIIEDAEYLDDNSILNALSTISTIDVTNNSIANCKIDGTTDDYSALSKIISSISSLSQPVTLLFPYTGNPMLLSNTIKVARNNVTFDVYCDINFTKSTFTDTESMNVFSFGNASVRTPITNINFIGHGITIDANGASTGLEQASHSQVNEGNGIIFRRVLGGRLSGVHITNALCDGCKIYNSKNVIVEDCEFSNTCFDNGLTVMGLPLFTTDWVYDEYADRCINNVIVRNCVAHNNEDVGFSASVCHGVTFENCLSYENGNVDGFNAGGGYSAEILGMSSYFEVSTDYDMDIKFINCKALNNNNYGFYNDVKGVVIDGCYVDKVIQNDDSTYGRTTRGGNGFYCSGLTGRFTIKNSTFKNCANLAIMCIGSSTVENTFTLENIDMIDNAKGIYVMTVTYLFMHNITGNNCPAAINTTDGSTKIKYIEMSNITLIKSGTVYVGNAELMKVNNLYQNVNSGITVGITISNAVVGLLRDVTIDKVEGNTTWLTGIYIVDSCGEKLKIDESSYITTANATITDKRTTETTS